MDTSKITINREDFPEFTGKGEPTFDVLKPLVEVIKGIRTKRPNWKYKPQGLNEIFVFQEAEKIGSFAIETRWTRQKGHTSKFKISAHNIVKTKGDNARRTENVNVAIDIVINTFRGRTSQELIDKYKGLLQSMASMRVNELTYKVDEIIRENMDTVKEVLRTLEISKEVQKMNKEIVAVDNELKEAEQSHKTRTEAAILVFKRPDYWQVILPGGETSRYKEFEEIPRHIAGPLAVLTMLEEDRHYVPNVGLKCNSRVFWILI